MGFEMFDEMSNAITEDTVRLLTHIQVEQKVEREQVAKVTGTNKDDSASKGPVKRSTKKIYPNDMCPCGSGKKYKNYLRKTGIERIVMVELDQYRLKLSGFHSQ